MKSKKPSIVLCNALASLIAVLMIALLGLGVRLFATAYTTQFIFSTAFVIPVVFLVLYFMLRRPARELTAHSLFTEPLFVKRTLSPRLCTVGGNPLTLDFHLPERPLRADLAVEKTPGDLLV